MVLDKCRTLRAFRRLQEQRGLKVQSPWWEHPIHCHHNKKPKPMAIDPADDNLPKNDNDNRKRKSSRRGKGEGSISQRSDGLWVGRLGAGTDATGKRLRKVVYGKTKKEAADKLTKLASQKLNGTLSTDDKTTVEQFIDRWLDDSASMQVRATTLASYKQICRIHVTPKIGKTKLSKLSPANVQNLLAEMSRSGKSPRLIQMAYTMIHLALSKAVKWGLVARNVAEAVDRPSVEKHEITPMNGDEILKFLKAAKTDRLYAMYVLALATGMRQGELFGLQRDDVDLNAATITVRRTLVELAGKISTNPPKTDKGRRLIELPKMATDELWRHGERMLAEGLGDCVWVFPDTDGNPLRRQNVLRRSFSPILKRAGLTNVRFHDLRHSSATLLLKAGVHPKVVQERLGHSQIGITMDTYSHCLPSMQKEAAGKLDSMLQDDGPTE